MVANSFGIIAHIVDDTRCQILVLGHYKVGPIDARLTLQNVAVVYQQQIAAILFALLINIIIGTHQCTLQRLALSEVPREKMSVNITGLNHLQLDGFVTFGSSSNSQGTQQQNHCNCNIFHTLTRFFCKDTKFLQTLNS